MLRQDVGVSKDVADVARRHAAELVLEQGDLQRECVGRAGVCAAAKASCDACKSIISLMSRRSEKAREG